MRTLLERYADSTELNVSTKSIEQKQRNTMKRELTEALGNVLQDIIGDSKVIALYRTEKGIMLGLDNAKVGIIPVEFSVSIKNMDCDPAEEEDAYNFKLQEQAEKKKRADEAKARKIAQQAEIKAAKEKLKALKNSDLD